MTDLKPLLVTFLATLSIFASATYAQDTDTDSPQDTNVQDEAPQVDKADADVKRREAVWLADSKTIFDIIEPLRQYKENSGDSSVQEKKRKRQLAAAIQSTNEKMAGKPLSLLAARVDDVTPEREITKLGIKKLQSLRKQIEKDPAAKVYMNALGDDWASNPLFAITLGFYLAGCEKCFRDTGRYIAKYSIVRETENEYSINDGIKIIKPETADGNQEEQYGTEKMISVEIDVLITSENQALKLKKGAVKPLKGIIQSINYEGSQYSEKVKIYLN